MTKQYDLIYRISTYLASHTNTPSMLEIRHMTSSLKVTGLYLISYFLSYFFNIVFYYLVIIILFSFTLFHC